MRRFISITSFVFLLFISNIGAYAQVETLKLYKKNKKQWLKTFSESSSGLRYKIMEIGTGKAPMSGDLVSVHYIGILENDTVFDNSYLRDTPLEFNYGVGQVIQGWDEGLGFLKEGGKAILIVPPELGYGNRKVGKINPGSTLCFQIELVKVESKTNLLQFNTAGKDTITLESGLRYIVVEQGVGAMADKNTWAYFHFVGYLPTNKIFDASALRGKPVQYSSGKGSLIPAFDLILPYMNAGSKFQILVPPELAYGDAGLDGVVAPNTPLKFDMELLYTTEKQEIKPFNVADNDTVTTSTGLRYIAVAPGEGRTPADNDVVKIHFTGYFENGEMFQSSLTNDDDIIFVVGQHHVIDGLDEVVKYMKIGSKVRALIPWQLGYGEEGNFPEIPPRMNLIFDVELVTIAE